MNVVIYDFSLAIQQKIVSMLFFEEGAFEKHQDIIKPGYFENVVLQDFIRIIDKFFKKYKRIPNKDEFMEELLLFVAADERLPEEEYIGMWDKICDLADTRFDYARDRMIRFAKNQAIKNAILKSLDLVKKQDFNKIWKLFDDVRLIGEGTEELGINYFESVEERFEEMRSGGGEWANAIPTQLHALDDLLGGGLPPRRLGILMGPMKRGKTMTLVNFGAGALIEKKNVVHIFFEGATERGFAVYYDSLFSGKTADEVKMMNEEERNEITQQYQNSNYGKLIIKHFPTRSCSPWTIEAYLRRLKAVIGFVPDLILIDYLGLMIPSDKKMKYESRYIMFSDIVLELISLIQKENYALWLGHQAKLQSLGKEVVGMQDTADSSEVPRHADVIVTINQTVEEKAKGEVRFYVAGSRFCRDFAGAAFKIDKERVRIEDL